MVIHVESSWCFKTVATILVHEPLPKHTLHRMTYIVAQKHSLEQLPGEL